MVEAVKTYGSVGEIAETLDKEIADTKSNLGEYLRKLDEIRTKAEKSKKIRETVIKLTGKKNAAESSEEIDVGSLKIVLDANAFHQLTIIESAVRSHQERLLVLQKAREALKPLDQLSDMDGLNFMVLENQGVPERILLKTS
jgi:DNA-directed RNA polymerase beta' subunit